MGNTDRHSRWRCIDGSVLKTVAVLTMLVDHVACFLLYRTELGATPLFELSLFGTEARTIYLYTLMRMIGRISFPIFSFLIVEGFVHTHDRRKYGINLLVFALISEIPWNLCHTGTLFCDRQNVMFTLFLGFLGMCAIEHFSSRQQADEVSAGVDDKRGSLTIGNNAKMLLALSAIFITAFFLRADYGFWGVGFILLLYALHGNHLLMTAIGGMIFLGRGLASLPAFLLIGLYNGRRGFIHGKVLKYCFYAFYPLHLLVIGLIKVLL